jgi:hypothetical protein
MKSVLSREEVAALLQDLSHDEPDHKLLEPGPAQERLDSEGLRGKKVTRRLPKRLAP